MFEAAIFLIDVSDAVEVLTGKKRERAKDESAEPLSGSQECQLMVDSIS